MEPKTRIVRNQCEGNSSQRAVTIRVAKSIVGGFILLLLLLPSLALNPGLVGNPGWITNKKVSEFITESEFVPG